MGGGDELQLREGPLQVGHHAALPFGVQVQVDLVDQHHTGGLAGRLGAVVRIEARSPVGDVGHHDVSDHAFEQRGLLHVPVLWHHLRIHVVVAHFGLIHASRVRQVHRLAEYLADEVPADEPLMVAGDFNDWGERLDVPMRERCGLLRAVAPAGAMAQTLTFPSRVPVFSLDRIYLRGLRCLNTMVPHGRAWARMSDHLPLLADLEPV